MRNRLVRFLSVALACALLAALPAHATAQAAELRPCPEQAQTLASRFLVARHLTRDIASAEPGDQVCKAWPGKEDFHLAVFVYDTKIVEEKRMLVTLLDLGNEKVVASYWAKVDADATTPYTPGSVHLDTAPYRLGPGVRAFGIDVDTRFSAVQESGHGAERTLYVREGSRIRPVLERMPMWRWEYIDGYRPYLNTEASPRPDTEEFSYSIGIAPTARKGFADLRVTRRSSIAGHATVSELLHYDGRQYPSPRE